MKKVSKSMPSGCEVSKHNYEEQFAIEPKRKIN